MLVRIVRMTFNTERVNDFKNVFEEKKELIAGFNGCTKVNLLQDISNPNIFFTISEWQDESFLETYRNSALFRETWSTVKQWFAAPPIAHSVHIL